jgi:hypothetical protein
MVRLLIALGFCLTSVGMAHVGGKDNCRVTLQTYFLDGKRKVDVVEVHVDSHTQCKDEAMKRKLSSEATSNDELVYRVNVIFAYRELALEPPPLPKGY